jgi:hypothetical protein
MSLATSIASGNIYLVPDGPNPLTRLTAILMYHGEMGLGKILTINDETQKLSDLDSATLSQLSRPGNFLLDNFKTIRLGDSQGALLKHGINRSKLLDLDCNNLSDHAWLACAFSYAGKPADSVFEGFAAIDEKGNIFRAGGIKNIMSAEEVSHHGMIANGYSNTIQKATKICTETDFKKHPYYQRFLDLVITK